MSSLESLKQPVTRSREFLEECWTELKKVHWPSRKEVQAATLVVVIGVVIIGVYLGAVDLVLTALVRWVLSS
jgi:preprotein translocase subunit SecE